MKNLFARAQRRQAPLIKAHHLGDLLSTIHHPALLVDAHGSIRAANRQTTALTAFTQTELTHMQLEQLLKGSSNLLVARERAREDTLPRLALLTRSRKEVVVTVASQYLGADLDWFLITLEQAAQRENIKAGKRFTHQLLHRHLPDLIAALQHSDPEQALKNVLVAGSKLLGNSSLGLYIGQGDTPAMRRVASLGKYQNTFPAEVDSPDIHRLTQTTLWQKGERTIITLLHQKARQAGLRYLASAPIVAEADSRGWLGFIVAGGDTDPPEHLQAFLQVLTAFAETIIHNNLLTANLRRALHEASYQLHTWNNVSENIRDGVISVSPQLTITAVNNAAEIIFGYAEKEVLHMSIDNMLIGTDRLLPAVENALRGTSTPNLGNATLHRRNGESFPVELAVTPIRNKSDIIGALILIRDISENEQIRIRSQQLEQRALLGEVTAVFAHEVRNPINNISLGLQLLQREYEDGDPNQERIEHMLEDCQRLTTLMDSVLTFSRTGNYTFGTLDVYALLERILTRWRPRLANANIQYKIQTTRKPAHVIGDKRSLEQVFTNIISNAVHAMSEQSAGTLSIKITTAQTPSGKSILQIDFADNGPGIPVEHQARIFDPFYTTSPTGTGLGLSITKQIITAHRGNITLTSFPGATVFHVQLPLADPMEKATQ